MTEAIDTRLNETAIEAVKKSLAAKNRLQFELNKSYLTIQRWLKDNSPNLAKGRALKIISEETGIDQNDLLLN